MALANEDRGVLVGAFIVEDGDEVLSITQGGQVVRSRIDENFRVMGRSTMGVKFVTPKDGDAVAVVARAVEVVADETLEESAEDPEAGMETSVELPSESADAEVDATIEDDDTSQ
jgi:DNA gyrase subunit A